MKKTQKQIVIDRIREVGFVDNFWAIQNYILRLGAIIYDLTKDGWKFEDRRFGIGKDKKNFFYHPKVRAGACCTDMSNFGQHFGECKNQPKAEPVKGLF